MNETVEIYSIGDLAREFDVTHRTMRFYEDEGLLSPGRVGSRRVYSKRDQVRLKLILRGKRLGFSLAEVRGMLELYDSRSEEHTSELQSQSNLVCRLLLEKKKKNKNKYDL